MSTKVTDPIGPPEDIHALLAQDDQSEITITRHPCLRPVNGDYPTAAKEKNTFKVKRLARNSDVFLLKGLLTPKECEAIIREAKENTAMTKALSEDSDVNDRSRYKCSVGMLEDSRLGGFCGDIGDATSEVFVKEETASVNDSKRSDLYVLHYSEGGEFVLHHDGKERMLTVIYYLNGVAGTWFPLVDTNNNTIDIVERKHTCFEQVIDEEITPKNLSPGKDGLLISGIESDMTEEDNDTPQVARIGVGDAIAFYNYQSLPTGENDLGNAIGGGYRDWRALHAGIPVRNADSAKEDGKWIATHWYHAPSLMVDPQKELKERMMYLMNKYKGNIS